MQAADWTTEDFVDAMKRADILINTTPLGMFPKVKDMAPVDLKLLPDGALVHDLVYNPIKTKFLKTAEDLGHPILSGLTMLLYQGEEAYRLFTGELPDLKVMKSVVLDED